MAWSTSEWEIVREIRSDVKALAQSTVTQDECDRRHPHRKPLVERASAYLTLLLLVAAVIAGGLTLAGLEARLVRLEPAAHAATHRAGPPAAQDAGARR